MNNKKASIGMIDTQGCALACVSAALRGGRLEPIRQLDFVNAPVCEAITADLHTAGQDGGRWAFKLGF